MHAAAHEETSLPAAKLQFGPRELLILALCAGGAALVGRVVPVLVPALVAGGVAALIPRAHGTQTRLALAAIAAVFALFIVKMWPGVLPDHLPYEPRTLLTWLIALPSVGAIAILFLPRQMPGLLKWTTMLVMFGTLAASAFLLGVPMGRGFHFNQDYAWIPSLGIRYHVAADGISLWLLLLTTLVTPIATFASFGTLKARVKDWCFALLLLEGAMLGTLVAMDLFLFYVFWELMLIPMYVMIGVWGGTNRIKAALKFFLYTFFGSILMLGAILYVVYTYAKLNGGAVSFDYFELQRVLYPQHLQLWLFGAFALAFLIKVPMFPFHTWLPDAHTEAPTAGSVILAAIMLKMGTYGYLRFCMGLFPEASAQLGANLLGGVAVLGGILYGALCAWKQDDVKRVVAYSSVAHLGYVMLGLFAATSASIEGSVLQMINHGISTGALFLLVGVIYDRRHTRQLDEFGGLAKVMPVYATLFIIVTLSSIGLPGTNGFVGEFMVITGTFVSRNLGHFNGIQAVGAALGVILGALYMLGVVQKMFFGPVTKTENEHLPDINAREILALAPLVCLIFVIGFFPNLLLAPMHDACSRVEDEIASRSAAHPAPYFYNGSIRLLARSSDAPAIGAEAPTTQSH